MSNNKSKNRGKDIRGMLFKENRSKLEELAYQAMAARKISPDEFVIVCINADDLVWTELAEYLTPDQNLQQYCDRNEKSIVRGSVLNGIREYISAIIPAIKDALYQKVPKGFSRVVVMDGGGASVYFVRPHPDKENNPSRN